MSELRVQDIMTEHVITLSETEDLSLAEDVMQLGRLRHLPVVDRQNRLVGLITHRDLLSAQVSTLAELSESHDRDLKRSINASQIMNTDVITTTAETPALHAARLMREKKIGCLPVVKDQHLVGIITEADYLSLVIRALEGQDPPESARAKMA